MQTGDAPELDWRDGTPIARAFDDPYFALGHGLSETEHVFLAGNDLEARLRDGFQVAELGVGTGLNLMAAWRLARSKGVHLHYTGFEAFPLDTVDLTQALAAFPEISDFAVAWVRTWQTESFQLEAPNLTACVVIGDARQTLPAWQGCADAWFLDGFAPARNPELWEPALLQEVARKTAPGGTFATYTAAGAIRRSLAEAGFTVSRIPGYGRKRHMTQGVLA